MELLTGFELTLGVDEILRGEGADPATVRSKKPAMFAAASRALELGFSFVHPSVALHRSAVLEHRHECILLQDGRQLVSPLLARHLAGAQQVFIVLTTIGPGLEDLASSRMSADPLLALALDGLGNAAVECLGEQVCARIGQEAGESGLTSSTPLSPGEPDWPVEIGQPQVFSFLDPARVGISLTSGGMMLPKKSISFVVGIGPDMNQDNVCGLCSFKERCRYRRA